MSRDDEGEEQQPDSDGLDALASGLEGNESEEADEDLDLASLAAVVGARATTPGTEQAPAAESAEKLVLAPAAPSVAAPIAPSSAAPVAAKAERPWLVPALVAFAIGVGVIGYMAGRSSRTDEPSIAQPPAASPDTTKPAVVAAAPALAPAVAVAPSAPAASPAPTATPSGPSAGASSVRVAASPRADRPVAVAAAPAPAPREAEGAGDEVAEPAEPAPPTKPAESPATLAKTEPAPSRSVDALLDEALSPSARRAIAAAPAELPEAPSRDEVTQAMAVLLPAIRGCAMGQTGLATAGIVVRGDGRVASVELSGAPFEGTASGRCMEGVLRRARFSRFRQPTFRVRFPFAIQ